MNRFGLDLNLGENAKVTVFFELSSDDGEPYVNFDTIEVMYKGIDIIDTLDIHDLNDIERQIMASWDLIEDQLYEQDKWI